MAWKRKQKPKTVMSPLQRKRLLRISCTMIVCVLLWVVFAPGRGLYHLRQQKKHIAMLNAERQVLTQQNDEMIKDIERLRNDQEYLEQVAREEHGMLRENEIVFDFSRKKKEE